MFTLWKIAIILLKFSGVPEDDTGLVREDPQLCLEEVCLGGEHMEAFRVGHSEREDSVSGCDICSGVANYLNRHSEMRALSASVVVFSGYF